MASSDAHGREWRQVYLMKKLLVVLCIGLGLAATSCAAYYDDLGTLEDINGEMTRGNEFADMFTVDGEAFFPIGIYYDKVEDYPDLNNNHFNVTLPKAYENTDAAIASVDDYKLKIIPYPYRSEYSGELDFELRKNFIQKYSRVDQILFWYIKDEPHFWGYGKVAMDNLYNYLRPIDERPFFGMLSPSANIRQFKNAFDIIGVDIYPIPDGKVIDVYKRILETRIQTDNERPIIVSLQVFPWSGVPSGGGQRAPSPQEVRSMVYLSFIGGAKGIFYFATHFLNWDLRRDNPLTWNEIKSINNEIQYLSPILLRGETRRDILVINNRNIKYVVKKYNSKYYFLAVNTVGIVEKVSIKIFDKKINTLDSVFKNESIPVKSSEITLSLKKFESMVLKLDTI